MQTRRKSCIQQHFIWIFTVRTNARLRVSSLQRVKVDIKRECIHQSTLTRKLERPGKATITVKHMTHWGRDTVTQTRTHTLKTWTFIYIIIRSGWILAWIFMKERVNHKIQPHLKRFTNDQIDSLYILIVTPPLPVLHNQLVCTET